MPGMNLQSSRLTYVPRAAAVIPRSTAVQIRSSCSSEMANGGMMTMTFPRGRSQTPSVKAC